VLNQKPLFCKKDTSFVYGKQRFTFRKGIVKKCNSDLYNFLSNHPDFIDPTDIEMVKRKYPEKIKPLRIIIMRNGGYGDILMGTAVAKAIKDKFPKAFIIWVTQPQFLLMLKGCPYVSTVVAKNWYASEIDYFKSHKMDCDLFFCVKPDGEVWCTNARLVEKYKWLRDLDKFYTKNYRNRYSYDWIKSSDLWWFETYKHTMALDVDERDMWMNLPAHYSTRLTNKKYAVIVPDGAGGLQTKSWLAGGWVEVTKYLQSIDYEVYQVGDRFTTKVPGTISLLGKTKLMQAVGYIKNCDLFLGCDGFMSHIAALYDVPNVCVFGPTPYKIWGHKNLNVVIPDYYCQFMPCWTQRRSWFNECLINGKIYGKCMESLKVEKVIKKIKEVLDGKIRRSNKKPAYQYS
jgi:ADP-heptose:LPS heptosyltransferase